MAETAREDVGPAEVLETVIRHLRKNAHSLSADELYVSETFWQTYRSGRWKSFRHRDRPDEDVVLIDLHADPGEQQNVAAAHPETAREHASRIDEITDALAAPKQYFRPPPPRYDEKLRALGYVE